MNPADRTTNPGQSDLNATEPPAVDAKLDVTLDSVVASPSTETSAPRIQGYEILGRLGEGGMGVVWRARQLSTRREVALKVMSVASFGSQRARARFEREVELAARLDHPGIARVFDGGLNSGVCFYAMELIEGTPLDQYVRDHNLPRPSTLALVRDICRAVQQAHQRGIIHRDLKPGNILITVDGHPKVLDFGLAKSIGGDSAISIDGEIAGTPAYMSPEQAAGRLDTLDTRSDVYTLGVILFHLLTGRFPHDTSGSYLEVMRRIAEQEPKRLKDIEPKPNAELSALLTKALAHEPERRYGSAGELADDIQRYLNHEPLVARPPTLSYLLTKRARKYRVPLTVAAMVLILLIGLAGWSYIGVTSERNNALAANIEKEKQRQKAEAQRKRAVEKEIEAERQKNQAIAAGERERLAKEDATRQAQAARREVYFSNIGLADAAIKEGDYLRAREILDECPPDLRQWEWRYLRQVSSERAYSVPVSGQIAGLAFHPSVDLLAVASGTELSTWDVSEMPPLNVASQRGETNLTAIAYDSDGSHVATVNERGELEVRSSMSLIRETLPVTLPWQDCKAIAFVRANDAVMCLGEKTGTVLMVDLKRGAIIRSFEAADDKVISFALSSDGKFLAGGCESQNLRVWNVETGNLHRVHSRIQSWMAQPVGVSFLKGDSQIAYVTAFDSLLARERDGGSVVWTQKVPGDTRPGLGVSEDRSRLAVPCKQGAAVFETAAGVRTRLIQTSQREPVKRVALSANGAWVAIEVEGGLLQVRPGTAKARAELSRQVTGAVFSVVTHRNSGRVAYIRSAHHPAVIEPDGSTWEFSSAASPVRSIGQLAWSARGDLLAWRSEQREVIIYDMAKRAECRRFPVEDSGPYLLQFADQDRVLLAGCWDGSIVCRSVADGNLLWKVPAKGADRTGAVVICPGGEEFLTQRWSEQVNVRSVHDGSVLRYLPEVPRGAITLSPDGKRLFGFSAPYLVCADWPSGQKRWRVKSGSQGSGQWTFSSDGTRLATIHEDRTVHLWDTATGRDLLILGDSPSQIYSLAWTPDGADLIAANQGAAISGLVTWHGGENESVGEAELPAPWKSADIVSGHWTQRNGTVIGSTDRGMVLTAPVKLDGSYRLHLEVTRRSAQGSFGLLLPVAGQQCDIEVAGYWGDGYLSGLDRVHNLNMNERAYARVVGLKIDSGVRMQLVVDVKVSGENARIEAELYGKRIVEWEGPVTALSPHEPFRSTTPQQPALIGYGGEFEFHRLQVQTDARTQELIVPTKSNQNTRSLISTGKTIDLLKLAGEVPLRGEWKSNETGARVLVSPPKQGALVPIPVACQGSYELTAELTRSEGEKTLAFVVPHPAGQVMVLFDSASGQCGLGRINGAQLGAPGYTGPFVERQLQKDQRHKVVIRVEPLLERKVKITVWLNDRELYSWSGAAADLSLYQGWEMPKPKWIGVGATECNFIIEKLDLKVIDGYATIRIAPAAATQPSL